MTRAHIYDNNGMDALGAMLARREVNRLAIRPVEFYLESFLMADRYLYPKLREDDVVVDIGCSNGQFLIDSARLTDTHAQLIGVDPYNAIGSHLTHNLQAANFTYLQRHGEDTALPDNISSLTMAHNALFRATDKRAMLLEMQRITKPNGLIMISTNGRQHAQKRHGLERSVAEAIRQQAGGDMPFGIQPRPNPAEGCYLEDFPDLIRAVPGLSIIDGFTQDSAAMITSAVGDDNPRKDVYIEAIRSSISREDIPEGTPDERRLFALWREVASRLVKDAIDQEIAATKQAYEADGIADAGGVFVDRIHRALFVMTVS